MTAVLDTSALRLGQLVTSAKGAKHVTLTTANEKPVTWTPPGSYRVIFPPKPYVEEATRVSLTLAAGDLEATLAELDQWAVAAAAAASEQLFGRVLGEAQVRDRYAAILKPHERFPAAFRLKMSVAANARATRFWTAEGERRSAPSDWTGAVVRPVVALKGFWLMGSSFGLMAEVTDLQITEAEPTACPF